MERNNSGEKSVYSIEYLYHQVHGQEEGQQTKAMEE
jgi:hypothetical protein